MFINTISVVFSLLLIGQCQIVEPEGRVTVQAQAIPAGFSPQIPIIWPPFGNKCCNTHNIYALDTSGSMWGLSWSKALAYLGGVFGSSDYTSLFTHGGTWSGPPFQVTNYLTHSLNINFLPALPLPNGDTDYDDALIRVIDILNQGYPEKTCISFISDGWEEIYNSPVPNIVQQFLTAKKSFEKKTGCPVCVKCYQTQKSFWGESNFEKLCKEIGAPVIQLRAILDDDAVQYAELSAKEKSISGPPTDNGPKPGGNPK